MPASQIFSSQRIDSKNNTHSTTAPAQVLKDIIVKYQLLAGRKAKYVPGWDCHGLPIELKVSFVPQP